MQAITRWDTGAFILMYDSTTTTTAQAVTEAVRAGTSLARAVLREADLAGADLRRAVLRDADLRGADLRGAVLMRADLRRADLTRADLRGADLTGADLTGADLTRADLRDATFRGADLTRADLTRATLAGANLWEADLTRADLREADLTRADLTRATLAGATLPGYPGEPAPASPRALIQAVRAWLTEERWIQKEWIRTPDGAYAGDCQACLHGAISYFGGSAVPLVQAALREQGFTEAWNDAPERTLAEVQAALDTVLTTVG